MLLSQQLPVDSDWMAAIPGYQREVLEELAEGSSLVVAAATWLESSGPSQTAPFGTGANTGQVFLSNVARELKKLLCTEEGYTAERKNIRAGFASGHVMVVGLIGAALGSSLGVTSVLLTPVVAALLAVITNAGRSTVCEKLNEVLCDIENA